MELLVHLKFSINRSKPLSTILIHLMQASYLSVLIAASFSKFYSQLFQIVNHSGPFSSYFVASLLFINIIFTTITLASLHPYLTPLKFIWPCIAIVLKLIPFLFFVPLFHYCMGTALNTDLLLTKIVSLMNIAFLVGFLLFHQFLNESLKFRQTDFCNRRLISYAQQILFVIALASLQLFGPFYGGLFYILRAVFILGRLFGNYQYQLVQRLQIFYSLLTLYLSIVAIMNEMEVVDPTTLKPTSNTIFLFVGGTVISWLFSKQVTIYIGQRLVMRTQWGGQRGESESISDKQQDQLQNFENQLKTLVQVLLERERHMSLQQNQYEHYWRIFNERVFVHRLKCQQPRCICKNKKQRPVDEVEWQIYILDLIKRVQNVGTVMGKQGRLKVVNIYLLVEIAKKPLKGYFELISLRKQKNRLALKLQVQDLISKTRECFDQIYYKNKVQNQQLDLLRVIQCEQVMNQLEQQLKTALTQTASFLQIFTYSTVKMAQVQTESIKLFTLKHQIQKKLERLVWEWGDNGAVSLGVFVFYRMLQVYRSRQIQFKKLGGQQVLKKRMLQKAQGEAVGQEQGIIYIDLVDERGRIRKITKNIGDFFGYSRQDMIGFNINLFMPSLFGKYHARFLSNFIDKGRIKLLKQKTRVVFGKNKKKFIFPINIRLKTEHLQQDQFGASALISKIDTSSEFIVCGNHGRIQEMTEGLYRRIFGKTLRDQVTKLGRLCGYKLILGLNQVLEGWQERQSTKIHEGLLIYAQREDYLFQKFRFSRETSYSSVSNKTKTLSMSLTSMSSASLPIDSRSERIDYFSQLFKNFLIDVDPHQLRAIKVSYKYSRIKTSQFQVQLIEIVTLRDELQGKQFLRELINELNNVAEIYQLLQQHSPLARHLLQIQDMLDAQPSVRRKSKQLALGADLRKSPISTQRNRGSAKQFSLVDKPSQQSFQQDQPQQKRLFNPQNSQQSSIIGSTESQSKKQLLINAFNNADSALAPSAVTIAHLTLFILIGLLGLITFFSYSYSQKVNSLWSDCAYILALRNAMQFRIGTVELSIFAQSANFTLANLSDQQTLLNSQMINLIQQLNTKTYSADNSSYSFTITLHDPYRNINYQASFPQVLSQLSWLYEQPTLANIAILRYNFQTLHQAFITFYNQRQTTLQKQNQDHLAIVKYLFAAYEGLLTAIALLSLPLYLYFKKQQITVRGKLAFMSVKQIKKAISRLHIVLQFVKVSSNKKGAVTKLQTQLAQKRGERQEQAIAGTRSIKITSDAQQSQVFRNPILYFLLFAFIIFFSNLSATLFAITSISSSFFLGVVNVNRLSNNLQIKTPLLLNVYLSNINRVLNGDTKWNFTSVTIDQTDHGYFQLINALSASPLSSNPIAQQIGEDATITLCANVGCSSNASDISLTYLTNSFKNRFNYWHPQNNITATMPTINQWSSQNNIVNILTQFQKILTISRVIRSQIQQQFNDYMASLQLKLIILAAILIPVNVFGVLIIARRFLGLLNSIIKAAEEIFMHFPVTVLVQNTYLTSYFNSKIKNGK